VSTTKLTRKEILTEDPVHEYLIRLLDLLREKGKVIAIVALAAVLVVVGAYFGLQLLESRDRRTQVQLGKAMDLYHARIDPTALDDPFGKGSVPLFRTEEAKDQAVGRAFQEVINASGSSKLGVIARYYLGLSQLRQGKTKDAIQTLEQVRNNTRDLTIGYLAKKVLAKQYFESGNLKGAQEILDGMVRDPQCSLPRVELKVELAKVYAAQGKRDQALKLIQETRSETVGSNLQSRIGDQLGRLEESLKSSSGTAKP